MTAMPVKLDENLGRTHVEFLRQVGYASERVHDEGLSGEDDPIVWQRVNTEGRFFITLDVGFSDVRRFPPGSHPGILLLRPHRRSRKAVLLVLSRVIREHPLEALKGCLAVADESQTRVRRPPVAGAAPDEGEAHER
jgi:predicted nuclease of predicted toxin-antitoxin system